MFERLDRIQIAAPDGDTASSAFVNILDAKVLRDDRSDFLGAGRRTLAVGRSAVEILVPDGPGPVTEFVDECGGGLFGVGFSSRNFIGLKKHLDSIGVEFQSEGDQVFLSQEATGGHGMPVVVTPSIDEELGKAGLIQWIYEATNIVDDHKAASAEFAQTFGLDAAQFHRIASDQFGYEGTLTLFHRQDRLDRIEMVTTTDSAKTMGRFAARRGESLYMFFMESDRIPELRERLDEFASGAWSDSPAQKPGNSLFIHPKALAGVLAGVSRTTVGWLWSGHPERVDEK